MTPREWCNHLLPLGAVGVAVANVAYAAGAWPFVAFAAGVGSAISVYYASRKRRARVKAGR